MLSAHLGCLRCAVPLGGTEETCQDPLADGSACADDEECASDVCRGGRCLDATCGTF